MKAPQSRLEITWNFDTYVQNPKQRGGNEPMSINLKIISLSPLALVAIIFSIYLATWGSTEAVRLIGLAGIIYLGK